MASHRLAGPNYLFAMPEVGIGFFPDVGASYALPRLKGAVGAWLAVTGARIKRADALELGLATHAVRAGCEEELLMHLMAGVPIESALGRVSEHDHDAPILGKLDAINRHFSFDSVGEILASLEAAGPADAFAGNAGGHAGEIADVHGDRHRAGEARTGSRFQRGDGDGISHRQPPVHDPDFYEGVRALIIDKDNRPHWNPARIEDVDPAKVAAHFEPLPRDLDLPGA